jgi:hypothetical protein
MSNEPSEHDSILFRLRASPILRQMVDCLGVSIQQALESLPERRVRVEPHANRWGHSHTIYDALTGALLGYVDNPTELNRYRYDACGYYVMDYSYTERFLAVS